MKIFKINDRIEIICDVKKTRNGFKHEATLMINGDEQEITKINYLNRTWERYAYESVLLKLIDKTQSLSDADKIICREFINKDNTDWSQFRTTFTIAKLGEIFADTTREKNDWKLRMLKAGISGIDIPEDWDKLNEDEKERRLNKVLELIKK